MSPWMNVGVSFGVGRFGLQTPWTMCIRYPQWELKWWTDTCTGAYHVDGLGWWSNEICFVGRERCSCVRNSFDPVLQQRVEAGDPHHPSQPCFLRFLSRNTHHQSQGLKAVSDPASFSALNHRKNALILNNVFSLVVLRQFWGKNILYCVNSHAFLCRY